MKKVLKVTLIALLSIVILVVAVVIVAVVAILLKPVERTTGVYQEKGGDVLYIADSSQQKSWNELIFLDNNDVLVVADEENDRIFKPLKQGNVIIADDEYFCGEYLGSTLYEVNVNENLDIEYTTRWVKKCYCLYHYMDFSDTDRRKFSIEYNDTVTEIPKEKYTEITSEFSRLYGTNSPCEVPDLSGCKKVIVEYTYLGNVSESFEEFYLEKDRIIYLSKNYTDQTTQWYEFTPDKCCNLDKLNELLTN